MDEVVGRRDVTTVVASDVDPRAEEEIGSQLGDQEHHRAEDGEEAEQRGCATAGPRGEHRTPAPARQALLMPRRSRVAPEGEGPLADLLLGSRSSRDRDAMIDKDGIQSRRVRDLGVGGPRDTAHDRSIYLRRRFSWVAATPLPVSSRAGQLRRRAPVVDSCTHGPLAQLVAHLHDAQGVRGSSPLRPTTRHRAAAGG